MAEDATLSIEALTTLVEKIFRKAGFSPDHAQAMARVIAAGERDGCAAHGVYRIDVCMRTLEAGKVDPIAEPVFSLDDSPILRVDAKGGFSCLAFERGVGPLAEAARQFGLAALVVNDCVHITALWPEVERLTEEGLAALALCPSYATVAPVGGKAPLLGTNPLAFGWPRRNAPPYVFDFATSVAARGEIELRRIAGEPLPEGWALDAAGEPTTDPAEALAGAMLPFGGHKGSAIATMIELLAAAMIGDLTSQGALDALGTTSLAPRHGELILAFSPERFAAGRAADPLAAAETLFEAILGQGARLPSQRRYAARAKSEAEGIVLSAETLRRLEART